MGRAPFLLTEESKMADKKKGGLVVAVGIGKPKGPPPPDDEEDILAPDEEDLGTEDLGPEGPPVPEEEEYQEGSYPEFTIPEGLDLSDLDKGEEKQVLCVVRKMSETEACFTQVDGVDLAGTPTGGMGGPPPAMPPPPPPPMGPGGPPPPPMGPPGPGSPVRDRAQAMGLM
jgi:hypothetical protein